MTINKYCFGLLPLCLSLTSWANTNGLTNIPLPNTTPTHRYYVEAHAGSSLQQWDTNNLVQTMTNNTTSADRFTETPAHSQMTYGADAGWQFADQFSIELGWYQQTTAHVNAIGSTGGAFTANGDISSWLGYLACRLTMFTNISNYFNLFAKLGISYNNNSLVWTGTGTANNGSQNSHVLDGIIGLGASVNITKRFYIGAQALYMLKNNHDFEVPSNTLVTATLGLQF